MNSTGYVIITPARNEAGHLPATIRSVAGQTVTPHAWVIVDDGSTDETPLIIEAACAQFPWIKRVRRSDRGGRKPGTGVIEAFYDGYALVGQARWDFLVKLDADLAFEPSYFEQCFDCFKADPRLGIAGGTICNDVNGALLVESEKDPAFHVRGATKIYRRACWDQIGGLIKAPGWDTLDELKANMLGWTTRSLPQIKLTHFRPAGNADGAWKNWVKNGRANYITGYHPFFMLCKCLKRTLQKPYGVAAAGLLFGFVAGYLKREPQVNDPALIKYVRLQQINRLLGKQSLWS